MRIFGKIRKWEWGRSFKKNTGMSLVKNDLLESLFLHTVAQTSAMDIYWEFIKKMKWFLFFFTSFQVLTLKTQMIAIKAPVSPPLVLWEGQYLVVMGTSTHDFR